MPDLDVDLARHVRVKMDGGELDRADGEAVLALLESGRTSTLDELLHEVRHPDLPRTVYHTAPTAARDSIREHGLRACDPGTGTHGVNAAGQACGVYVADVPDARGVWCEDLAWDVWTVDTSGLAWEHDPINARSWVLIADVPAERVALYGTFGDTDPCPPLDDVIVYLESTEPASWWAGPTYRSPDGTQHCALSHIEVRWGMPAMEAFESAFSTSYVIGLVNDGENPRYLQDHPKDRCLAYLRAMAAGIEETTEQSMERQYLEWLSQNEGTT